MTDTDPEYWFLSKQSHTIGNDVVALVDGAIYMKHLYDRFIEMQAGDLVCYTAWRATPDQKMRPDLSSRDTRLQPVFMDLIQRRMVVRILAWYAPFSLFVSRKMDHPLVRQQKENKFFVEDIRKAIGAQKLTGSAFIDERLPYKIASHHQKSIVLTAKGKPWAYVGGIDIAFDRWDTTEHSSPPERQKEILDAWHDVQCVISGPAVRDIAENFRDRWNERKPPVRHKPWDLPEPMTPVRVPDASQGTMMVQRLRTLACKDLYDFKKSGEQTAREGINQAIERSKYYVYLEDQYFWPCTTIDFLARAIRRGVYVFLVLAKEYDLPEPAASAHYEMRKSALDTLRDAGQDKLICCHLEQRTSPTQIYVHSKFMIVDDRFVTIGSTNVGRRSHTTDSELHVSILDAELVDGVMNGAKVRVCKFAKELRKRVWNEHLNVAESQLEDPITARSQWPSQGKGPAKVHHAVYHAGEPPTKPITLWDWYRLVKTLRELAQDAQPWPHVDSLETTLVDDAMAVLEKFDEQFLQSSLTDLVLGPLWWDPRVGIKRRLMEFLKNRIMNVETMCGS